MNLAIPQKKTRREALMTMGVTMSMGLAKISRRSERSRGGAAKAKKGTVKRNKIMMENIIPIALSSSG